MATDRPNLNRPAIEETETDIELYTRIFAESAAEIIKALKATEGIERRKIVTSISKAAMAANVDVEAAGALAHLLNTHGQ